MSVLRYADYSRDSAGWFLGMTGVQLALVTTAGVPALLAAGTRAWPLLLAWLPAWALLAAAVLVPVRGRPAAGWSTDLCRFAIGGLMGWNDFLSRAATGL